MRKRVLSLFLSFILLLPIGAVKATGEVELIQPENGSVVTDDVTKIVFYAQSGSEVSVLMDGTQIFKGISNGENTAELESPAAIGSHDVEIRAYTEDGSFKSVNTFKVIKRSEKTDFSYDFTNGARSGITVSSNKTVGTDESGMPAALTLSDFEGKDGDETGSIGAVLKQDVQKPTLDSSGNPGAGVYYYKPISAKGRFSVSYDLKLFGESGSFELESRSSAGFAFIGGKRLFGFDGRIQGTDYVYPKGEWMSVRHTVDLDGGTQQLYINGEEVKNAELTAADKMDKSGLTYIKLQYYISRGGKKDQGFMIDNFCMTHEESFEGFGDIYFRNSDSAFEKAGDSIIKTSTDEIRFESDIFVGGAEAEEVHLFVGEKETEISEITAEDSGTLTLKLAQNLLGEHKAKLYVKSGGTEFYKAFYISQSDFAVNGISVKSGENEVFDISHIRSGDKVSVYAKNNGEKRMAVIFLTVYSGGRMLAVSACTVSAESGQSRCAEFELPKLSGDDMRIEIYAVDSYTMRIPLCGAYVWK